MLKEESKTRFGLHGQLLALSVLLTSCSGGGGSTADPVSPDPQPPISGPQRFFCAKDSRCPELLVEFDPHATLGGNPSPFRGYGDPSLAFDPTTNTLWMAYSWLDILVNDPGPPPNVTRGVRTHLASSTDGGTTFQYANAVNQTEVVEHPQSGETGWLIHEVPTLTRRDDGSWMVMWLQYFSDVPSSARAPMERRDFLLKQSVSNAAKDLGVGAEGAVGSDLTGTGFGAFINLNDLPELSDCAAFAEPALFSYEGADYVALQCIVLEAGQRQTEQERLFLLRHDESGYTFIGNLTDSDDARQLGADVLTQPDIAVARDGSVILLVTPKILGGNPEHQGCVVATFSDFEDGLLRRGGEGRLVQRTVITAEGNGLGPGLCTYHAESNTGILLVITAQSDDPFDLEFSLRRTGVHP